jgi:hypothetical protein
MRCRYSRFRSPLCLLECGAGRSHVASIIDYADAVRVDPPRGRQFTVVAFGVELESFKARCFCRVAQAPLVVCALVLDLLGSIPCVWCGSCIGVLVMVCELCNNIMSIASIRLLFYVYSHFFLSFSG